MRPHPIQVVLTGCYDPRGLRHLPDAVERASEQCRATSERAA